MSFQISPFSDYDHQQLSGWLARRSTRIRDIVELEGFLTAIVIGPNTLSPAGWLQTVWGGRQPKFKDFDDLNRFVALVMGYHNDIVACFEQDAERFEPTFYESKVGGKRVLIVDEWCVGFLKGMRQDAAAWKPLKQSRPDLLKPIQLFGSPAGWKDLEAGGDGNMHKSWSRKIAPSVRAIYQYWLPARLAAIRRPRAGQRTEPPPLPACASDVTGSGAFVASAAWRLK
jgi:uncharacterized protein